MDDITRAMSNRLERNFEKAIGLIQQGQFAQAKPLVVQLSRKAPKHPLVWNLLGVIVSEDGDYDRAVEYFRKAAKLAPRDADFHNNLGEAYRKAGRSAESLPCFEAALKLPPAHAAAHNNLGAALNALHREEEAVAHLSKAVQLRPDNYEAYANLGMALINQRKARQAIPCFERAYQLNPEDPVVLRQLGHALEHDDRFEEALELYDKATEKIGPDNSIQVERISNLERQGRKDEAWELLTPLLESAPDEPGVVRMLAVLSRRTERRDEAYERLRKTLQDPDLDDDDRIGLYFASGELADSMKRYDEAFDAYAKGNALVGRPYDHAAFVREQDASERVYAAGWQQRLSMATNRSELPVFIVGMPRSGTTLTEQILACHRAVHGAGELTSILDITKQLASRYSDSDGYPDCVTKADVASLDQIADQHLSFLQESGGEAIRVIDKLPHNHRHLGLINQLFPGARVIHCTRDAADTCLSCFFQSFYGGHGYSNDLTLLGAHYRLYQRAMAHWCEMLDIPILEVPYETLVGDQEAMSREMVAFLDLPWGRPLPPVPRVRSARDYGKLRPSAPTDLQKVRASMGKLSLSFGASFQRARWWRRFKCGLNYERSQVSCFSAPWRPINTVILRRRTDFTAVF